VEYRYFDKPGPGNTGEVLRLAALAARERGIGRILVASTTGATALEAARALEGLRIIAVTHSAGFSGRDIQELLPEHRAELERRGAGILTCQHALGGVGRAVRRKLNSYQLDEIIAYTLRTIGQGFKVCLEISLMAADAGMTSASQRVLAIGGTGSGADTAVILTPANAQDFFDLRVHEVICKPRDF
jgi:hypothetical protein